MSVEVVAGGRYRVVRALGHGGMASVLLAHDEELDRRVAIKLLAENLASDEAFRERFLREARLAARLAHPNIVQVFDAGTDDGRPYIVMEHVEGESLADELERRGKLNAAEAVDVGLQVCAGLEHAHEAGLVHRDIKPANLLRRPDGVVKIADFGIARAAETTRLTEIGTILGTAGYLSPEQATGEEVTSVSDLYSLGAVLYELLTGRPPYEVQSLAQLPVVHREGAPTPVRELEPSVAEPLEAVVMRCLARNPRYRPQSARELAHELSAAGTHAPTMPAGIGPPATDATVPLEVPRPSRAGVRRYAWPRLERMWLPLAAAAAVALAIVALAVTSLGGEGAEEQQQRPPRATPAPVEPVPEVGDPGEQARALAEWLRENSSR